MSFFFFFFKYWIILQCCFKILENDEQCQITLFSFLKMADIDGKDAVEILCMMENEEKDETVLMLSKSFLSQKLQIGDMYYLWWVLQAL